MTRGPEMTEFRQSRGCLGAETIESSRSQETWEVNKLSLAISNGTWSLKEHGAWND